jgi:DNA-binding GntR family transcriptional regulator
MLAGDLVEFARQDRQMHALLVRTADNSALTDYLGRIDHLIQMARNLANQRPGFPETTDQQRHALLDAFKCGDIGKAVDAMRRHIESVREAIVAELQSQTTHVLKPVV